MYIVNSVYKVLLWSQFVFAGVMCITLFFIVAPYGRHLRTLLLRDNSLTRRSILLSKRQGWYIMEIPAVLSVFFIFVLLVCMLVVFSPFSLGEKWVFVREYRMNTIVVSTVFLIIWELHYIYRACVYPHIEQDVAQYFQGYVVVFGALFSSINGFLNGWELFFMRSYESVSTVLLSPHFLVGIVLFFIGFYIHVTSDRIIRILRKQNGGEYTVPSASLHAWVASPNYFGEIIQWWGWALLTWSVAGVAFAVFTMANLLPRAISNLKWYRATFDTYPPHRKALIPFVL